MKSKQQQTKNTPLVSIIIPAYNRETLIAETLDSVIKQTYTNWECIVVDDGSTDKTIAVIEKYATNDDRFKFYRRARLPKGAPTCRNIGIEKCTGEYVMFLDSDDLILPFCIQTRVAKCLRNQDRDFLVFNSEFFKHQVGDTDLIWNIYDKNVSVLDQFLTFSSVWGTPGAFYKKIFLEQNKVKWREGLQMMQDIDFHINLLILHPKILICFEQCLPDVAIRINSAPTISQDRRDRKKEKFLLKFTYHILLSLKRQNVSFQENYAFYPVYNLLLQEIHRRNYITFLIFAIKFAKIGFKSSYSLRILLNTYNDKLQKSILKKPLSRTFGKMQPLSFELYQHTWKKIPRSKCYNKNHPPFCNTIAAI